MNHQLAEQIDRASVKNEPVQAWFRLKPGLLKQEGESEPEETEALVKRILDRVIKKVGRGIQSMNVQRLLGTFTVFAEPAVVAEVAHQPEIEQAGPTHIPELGLIRPVESKMVRIRETPKPRSSARPRKHR